MSETDDPIYFEKLSLVDAQTSFSPPDIQSIKSIFSVGSVNAISTMTAKLESDAFKSLKLIGVPALSEKEFSKALEDGPKSVDYTKLVSFLTNELRMLCNIDECVNPISAPEDSVSFIMETSSFLKELGCPYPSLTQGHVSDRLSTVLDRILLVQHLIGELMAARILGEKRPEKKIELKLQESSQAADLRKILQTLGFPKPPANITMQTLMQKLIPTVQSAVQKAGTDLLGSPILNGALSNKQWDTLLKVQEDLHGDYRIRREMMLKRLDCTIQSFQWSDKTRGKDDLFEKTYSEKRKLLKAEPEVDLSDLLASRDDLAIIEKTSSASVRKNTKSSINKVIIGQVPDRGGRTSEQAPPPPEMPPWQQRSSGPSGGGGFRGGQRGGSNYSGGGSGNYSGGGGSGNYSGGGGGGNYSGGRPQSNYNSGRLQSSYSGGSGFRPGPGCASNFFTQIDNKGSYNNSRSGGNRGSFDSAGSYGNDSSRNSNYYQDSRGNNDYSKGSSGGYSRGGYDSAGSYGGYSQDYQEPKRAKTYDQFQQNKTTYADQYVQESQHNQQYHPRDNRHRGGGGRGRSNYNRGGGGGGYR